MSSTIFSPNAFSGLGWNYRRYYEWNTGVQVSLSGKRSTIDYMMFPLVHFEYEYNIIHDDTSPSELQALMGVFNSVAGRFDTFLMTDPDFNTIPAASPTPFAISTGLTSTQYQLTALYAPTTGGFAGVGAPEIIQNLNGTPVLYDQTSATVITSSHYTIGPTGLVTFTTPTTAGHAILWSGSWWYRVEFDDDTLADTTEFMHQWWTTKIKLTSVIL
jgi:hypothetical protein